MNKKLLVSVFLIFFAFSFMLLSQEESEEKMKWEDERISITVDKIERVDSFPERMKSKSQDYTPLIESTRPIKGCDLVFIHITIVEKRDLRVQAMDLRMQRPKSPHLVDDQGKEALNFQISVTIYGILAGFLIFLFVGFLLLPAVILFDLVMIIVAAVKANQGIAYRYPLCIRFM